MLGLVSKRSIQVLLRKPQSFRMVQSIHTNQINNLVNIQNREFAKKKGKGKKAAADDAAATTEDEAEPVAEAEPVVEATPEPTPEPVQATPTPEPVAQNLFEGWGVGDIAVTQEVPDNRPPSQEDTIEGRYAYVLFVSASEQKALYDIYEDFQYLSDLYDNSEDFRLFTQNAGIGMAEMKQFNIGLQDVAPFHAQTFKFLEVLAENKRLVYLRGIAERYAKLYQQVNKEEKITIISAHELNDSERAEVLSALQQNPQNAGKQFNVDYTIDDTIGGGLQMYTETEFKDMSLNSRMSHLRNTISKLTE